MAPNHREMMLIEEMNKLNEKVYNVCSQVKLINQQIQLMNIRYVKALQMEQPSFRYSLRLRLATYEGVRGQLLQYARMVASKMDDIEETILNVRTA